MNDLKRPAAAVFLALSLLIISLLLDPAAGKMPEAEWIKALSNFLSFVGNGVFLVPACALLYVFGSKAGNAALKSAGKDGLLAIVISGAAVHVLKAAFERPRAAHAADYVLRLLENPALIDLTGRFNSFPSGHTTASFAAAYVLSRRFPRLGVLFYGIAFLIGLSRVYLGSHYPSDVAAGAVLGVVTAYLVSGKVELKEKWLIYGLAILILFISFFKTGSFLLFDIDEAVFSEASREMAETGDIITPTYSFEPRYDKPILIYWLMSLSFKLLGVSEFAARFTSGAAGSLLVVMTFFFIRRVRGVTAALFVSLALLLNLEFFVYTHSAVTDMTLTLFITASVYSFWLSVNEGERPWAYSFWAASALAVLTKGVIGALFPCAVALIYLIAVKTPGKARTLLRPAYIALFLAISVPWFAAEFYVNGWEFFNAFIIKHHIQRYSGVISSHGGPVYFYFIVLLGGFFPWVAFLPGSLFRAVKERSTPGAGLTLLCAIWLIFVFVFFTLARTKLPNYILPLFPPAAVLAGLSVSETVEGSRSRLGLYLLILISILIGAALIYLPFRISLDIYYPPQFFLIFGSIILVIGVITIMAFHGPIPSFAGISSMMVILLIFLRLKAIPPANIYLQKTLHTYSTYASTVLGKEGVLAAYEINKPSIAFYAKRKVLKVEKRAQCDMEEGAKKGPLLVITEKGRLGELKGLNLKVMDAEGDFVLLGNSDGFPPLKRR